MPVDRRKKDADWQINMADAHTAASTNDALLAVLMDLRDELKAINRRLDCPDTCAIPRILRRISANTAKQVKK